MELNSVRAVLRGFGIVPMDLHLIRAKLLLLFNCMLNEAYCKGVLGN